MSFSISGEIERDQVLGPQVRRASQILEQAIGPTSQSVAANWTLVGDASGRQLVILNLADYTGAHVEAKFAPDELAQEGYLRAKFYRIWGDLLQHRSHQQLNQLSGRTDVSGQ